MSPRAAGDQLAERLAHEVVELRRQGAVRPCELPQVDDQVAPFDGAGRVLASPLARQALELPEIPLLCLSG